MKRIPFSVRFSNQFVAASVFAFVSVALLACVDEPARRSNPRGINDLGGGAPTKLDPQKAAISASVSTKSMEGVVKGDYPSLTLSFTNADTAQVYRCGASFKLVYGNGLQELSKLPKTDPEYPRAAKDAFLRIRTEGSSCQLIVSNIQGPVPPTVNDYGAQSGNFYYVINPCVTSGASVSGSGGCSFDLNITQPINYTNTRMQSEIEILSTMYAKEGALYSLFKEIQNTTEAANKIRTTCALDEADRQAAEAHSRGLLNLVMAIAKPVVSALVPGVGTLLTTAVEGLVQLKQQQSAAMAQANAQSKGCPEAAAREERVAELVAQVDATAKEVLEQRQKLHQMDQQYASIESELTKLKNSGK